MELLLVRHALPQRVESTVGPADPPLTDDGHRQSQLLADYLADEPLVAVYSSPMLRAIQTAQPIAERRGVELEIVDDFAEYDRHATEYIPIEELRATGDPRFHAMATASADDLDGLPEFRARVMPAVEAVIAAHPGRQSVAIVCHGGVINVILAEVLGVTFDLPGFFYPNYTSVTRLMASRTGKRSMLTVNETAHLRDSGLAIGLFQKG